MRRADGGLPEWRVAPPSSEPPQSEWAPVLAPPRLAACRDKHRRGRSEGQSYGRSGGETHGSKRDAWTDHGNESRVGKQAAGGGGGGL